MYAFRCTCIRTYLLKLSALANKNSGYPVIFGFQVNIDKVSISIFHSKFGTWYIPKHYLMYSWNSNLTGHSVLPFAKSGNQILDTWNIAWNFKPLTNKSVCWPPSVLIVLSDWRWQRNWDLTSASSCLHGQDFWNLSLESYLYLGTD